MLPWAITIGDPAGIGPEIIIQSFAQQRIGTNCFVVGDVDTMHRALQWINQAQLTALKIETISHPEQAMEHPADVIPVLQATTVKGLATPGQISAQTGQVAYDSLMWATQAALSKQILGMVTAPLHKQALSMAGVQLLGHTEILQQQTAIFKGVDIAQVPVRMMLANESLRTVLVSIHVSMRDALDAVTLQQVLQTIEITHHDLQKILNQKPRIAVAGLNPHAGEGGLMGREEIDIIAPAIEQARQKKIDVYGPISPDTVFMRARHTSQKKGEFDVVIAMYHDQGLIPVKYLGLDEGVNITLGLPFVRTSPDHGTALDLAGKAKAQAQSMVAAIQMAKLLAHP